VPRFRLDTEDIAKVRVSTLGPFSEAWFSLGSVNRRSHPLVDGWRASLGSPLGSRDDVGSPSLTVLRPRGSMVDLHTVVGRAASIDEALATLQGAPAAQLGAEISPAHLGIGARPHWVRRWLRDLADADRQALHELTQRIRSYYREAIEPHWPGIRQFLEVETARVGSIIQAVGIGAALDSLHPGIRWRPPFLEVHTVAEGPELRPGTTTLGGRSLLVVPSVFGLDAPHVLYSVADETLPPVLVYPALRDVRTAAQLWAPEGTARLAALERLLGRTRAHSLELLAIATTTGELARRLGVSPATASHHVTALRNAHLVASTRSDQTTLHHLTPLGRALLDGRTSN
jgi:DNA-binding transcriptional ArsR family regulator